MAFSRPVIEKLYDRFFRLPLAWEIDAAACRATARSPYRKMIVDRLELQSGSKVLDVACGTGFFGQNRRN